MIKKNGHLPVFQLPPAVDTPTRTPPEREIVCVTLKKDQKLGFGEFHVDETSVMEQSLKEIAFQKTFSQNT